MKIIDFRLRPPYKRFKDVGLFVNLETDTAEIARKMNLVRSTICEHRKRSLNLMKEVLEERKSDEK